MSRDGTRMRLRVTNVPLVDTYQFAGANTVPSTASLDVTWDATAPFADHGFGAAVPPTDPGAFTGRFAPARAVGRFWGQELGFQFQSDPGASSDLGYAEFGTQSNGSFL